VCDRILNDVNDESVPQFDSSLSLSKVFFQFLKLELDCRKNIKKLKQCVQRNRFGPNSKAIYPVWLFKVLSCPRSPKTVDGSNRTESNLTPSELR